MIAAANGLIPRRLDRRDIVRTFPGYGAMVHQLADGRTIRMSITGPMMLTSVGGDFVRYLTDSEIEELEL
jgi:hypothetical protein